MSELVAIGQDPGKSWRQTIPPGVVIRLGRAPRQGWMVPWDPCISREHVDLILEGSHLKVRCLENTTNPTYYQDQPIREFTLSVGERFRIASTDFYFVAAQAPPPPVPESTVAAPPPSAAAPAAAAVPPAVPDTSATPADAIRDMLKEEVETIAWAVRAGLDIGDDSKFELVHAALQSQIDFCRDQIFSLLSFFFSSHALTHGRLHFSSASKEQQEIALDEIIHVIPNEIEELTFPVLEQQPPKSVLEQLPDDLVPAAMTSKDRLKSIIADSSNKFIKSWTRASALYDLSNSPDVDLTDAVVAALSVDNPMVRECAVFTLAKLSPDAFHKHKRQLLSDRDKRVAAVVNRMRGSEDDGEKEPMLTVERVLVLKTVSIFSETSEQVLADIIPVLEEVDIQAGETLFKQGDLGNCMYIIHDGKVRIHRGEKTFCELGPLEIFGEMTALDPEPRSASVTAVEDTRLFQLDQETLLDLMSNRTEIVRGVIHVLCQRLRAKDAS